MFAFASGLHLSVCIHIQWARLISSTFFLWQICISRGSYHTEAISWNIYYHEPGICWSSRIAGKSQSSFQASVTLCGLASGALMPPNVAGLHCSVMYFHLRLWKAPCSRLGITLWRELSPWKTNTFEIRYRTQNHSLKVMVHLNI